jgi:UTP--glucose-1-phosphate uridylyltransferase
MKKQLRPITKAVIATAGYGTRFLPATKNQPKEMLPLIDKPIIQYVVEEAVASGIKDIIIVTRAGQTSLEDHFDSNVELEYLLENRGKEETLREVQRITQLANIVYVRQKKDLPYGNATPMLCAAPLIDDDEVFVYMFGDDLVWAKTPATKQLITVFEKYRPTAVLAVQETPWEEVERYATVLYKKDTKINQIEQILEKLPSSKALSNMVQLGRFVFTYKVIKTLRKTPVGKGEELWVTDVLNRLAKKQVVIAQPIEGKWMTTGDPLNFLKTTVELALRRKDLGSAFRKYLKSLEL